MALTIYDFDATEPEMLVELPPAYASLYDENVGVCRYMAASFYEGETSIDVIGSELILHALQYAPVASIVYPIG